MNLNELRQSAAIVAPEEIRAQLPLQYVMERHGITLEPRGSRLVGLCCFHNDTNPSLSMYKDEYGVDKYGCFSCNSFGDVIDFVRNSEGLDFKKALDQCNALIKELKRSHWTPTELAETAFVDFSSDMADAWANDLQPFIDLVFYKKWPIDAERIADVFSIGCLNGKVVIPFFKDGMCVGYKIRTPDLKISAPGSKFRQFYGDWLDQGQQNVILTEGEPDTWVAFSNLNNYAVLGSPAGMAGHFDLERLQDRDVVLAFDGDKAGRDATKKWVQVLNDIAASIRVVSMPDGYDLAMLADVKESVANAQPLLPYTGNVYERNGLFTRAIKTGEQTNYEPISNWGFTPQKELKSSEGGVAYQGLVTPINLEAVITSDDLSSSTKLHQWSQHYGLGWRGTDKDARDILIWLESQGPYLAAGKMTRVLGLHDGHFILPERTIGEEQWVFLPKPGIVTKYLDFNEIDNVSDILSLSLRLHIPAVIHPILAWLFAAPVRSLFDDFPILAAYGSSGVGKTTLFKTLTSAISGGSIGGKDGISLADTTKHAITENTGATNAIPVWFDEYRASIRLDTRDALHNTLLAAYSGQTSSKGAVLGGELGVTNWEHNAPIIVTGETTFEETAHVERMITVPLPMAGRNPKTLRELQSILPSGVPNAYVKWLIYVADLNLRVHPTYDLDVPSRVQNNLGILKVGWSLLREFMTFHDMTDPGEPDFSLIIAEAQNIANEDPVLEAIKWAIESANSLYEQLVILLDGFAYVRVEPLVAAVRKEHRFPLPGNAKAIRRLLEEKYEGVEVVISIPNKGITQQTRFTKVDVHKLGLVS